MSRPIFARTPPLAARPSRPPAPWLAALAALAAAGVAGAGEQPLDVGATLHDGDGCEIQPDGCRALATGAPLYRERRFEAGERGAVLELRGGGVARLEPHTRLRVSATQSVPLEPSPMPGLTVHVERGAAQIVVGERAAKRAVVLLRLPRGRCAIVARGMAAVHVDGDRALVSALEKDALASHDCRDWSALPEGRARRLDGATPKGEEVPLLGAPSWRPSVAMTTDLHAKSAPLRLAWSGHSEASGYELVVRRQGEGLPALVKRLPSDANATVVDELPAGAYVATLLPLDGARLEGRASPPLGLRVVGVELPAGATVSHAGLVRLGPDQEVRLRYADGLEASTGLGDPFGPAPATLGLAGRGQRLVRLRSPGGEPTAELLLSRRALRAEVDVGRHQASRPSTPLDVRVRLLDQDGARASGDALATPLIMLGLRPVDARWQRVGNELQASLTPEQLAGASVVRVEVLDERGVLVGRNFVELAPEEAQAPVAMGAPR